MKKINTPILFFVQSISQQIYSMLIFCSNICGGFTSLIKLLCILLFIGSTLPSNAQWTEHNNGLYAGDITASAVSSDGSSLYIVLQNGGIYKSINNGANWTLTTNNYQNQIHQILLLVVHPSFL